MINNINEKFLYFINYPVMEKELCKMEMRCLFKRDIDNKYFYSNIDINASRSPFVKCKIKIIYIGQSLEEIIHKIEKNKLAYEDFKVSYVKSEQGDVEYEKRLEATKKIGLVVNGYPDMHNPKNPLAITKINGLWVFGEYERNNLMWQKHNDKPYSYSNAVTLKMARALVNIAMADNQDGTLIDPCCGVGTVVIEALDMGIRVRGCEISKQMAFNARENVEYLGYDRETIKCFNMHEVKEKYDVSIVDIPYGIFSPTTLEDQLAIINTARTISDKMVILTFEDMEKYILEAGFAVVDQCVVPKGNFKRHILICK